VLRLGTPEHVVQGDEGRAHETADRWRQGREVRRGRWGRAQEGRRVLGSVTRAVLGPHCQLACGRAACAGDQRAHLVEAGLEHVLRDGNAAATRHPAARGKCGAPHEP